MIAAVDQFPSGWLTSVQVTRAGGADPRGNPLPGSTHTVDRCLVSTQTTEEESRTDLPDTSAYIFAAPGANFEPRDEVTVPKGDPPLWPHGRFVVNGDPSFTPLGTRVQLRRV